jgi:hypothetical protein
LCCGEYVWSISSSETDPLVNVGPIPDDDWLYLWIAAAEGFVGAEFRVTGSLIPVSFEPMNGAFVAPGSVFPDVLLAVPECEGAPFLAGRISVARASSVEASSWGRSKAIYRW